MKILHITTSLENGGAEALLHTLVRADSLDEHRIICLYRDGHYGPLFREHGYKVESLDIPRGKITVAAVKNLYQMIKQSDADVIQGWMYHANLLAGFVGRLAGKKCIAWGLHNTAMQGVGVSAKTNIVNRVCAFTSRFLPKYVVHSSKSGAKEHIELGYSESKMSVIHGGYDLTRFDENSANRNIKRSELQISDDEVLIGMFARWHPQKDHANLIQAIASLDSKAQSRVRIALFGDEITEENTKLMQLLDKYEVREKFILVGPVSDPSAYMNSLDFHVLSSAYGESFPNVVSENMACCVPCIVTDVADSAVIVGDVGKVVPPSAPEPLARAVEEYLSEFGSPEWSKRRSDSRKRVIDNFSEQALVENYRSLWQSTVSVG